MAETQETQIIVRTAVALTKFLDEAKAKGSTHSRIANKNDYPINSFGKISLETGLKKNTVADIFNGTRSARIPTLIMVLEALNKTMADFGKAYDRVTDSDIQKFKERAAVKNPVATAKKKTTRK